MLVNQATLPQARSIGNLKKKATKDLLAHALQLPVLIWQKKKGPRRSPRGGDRLPPGEDPRAPAFARPARLSPALVALKRGDCLLSGARSGHCF
jgi:hypothetical protein